MKVIIITGASSGIGKEFAHQLDRFFHNIDEFWLVARREEELHQLSKKMKHRTRIFSMDITRPDQLDRLEYSVRLENAGVCMLINCAGYGVMGDFAHADRKSTLGMIRLNCEALTDLTHRMIPYMLPNARIINLASSAGFLPQADFAVYAASKSYVLSFSRALNQELKKKHIHVTAVCPGPVDTPFFDIAEKSGKTLALKKYAMVQPQAVVSNALHDSFYKKSRSICSLPIMALDLAAKVLPHDLMLWGMGILKETERTDK